MTSTTALAERMAATMASAPKPLPADIEKVLVEGNLAALKPEQRVAYYNATCQSLGLNPLTTPFDYLNLNGKLRLYAKKDATDQLRRHYAVSIRVVAREVMNDVYVVTARATLPSGREDESTGAVTIRGKSGEDLANAWMKAETKAKRRVTLSICGLGFLDESELESVRGARFLSASQAHSVAQITRDAGDTIDSGTDEVINAKAEPAAAPGMITEAQRKRLFAIAGQHGWSHDDIKEFLKDGHGIASTRDIPTELYEHIIATIEADNGGAPAAEEQDVI